MIEAAGILWLRPWWLLLVPLALAVGLMLRRRGRGLGAWERAVDPDLLAELRRLGRVRAAGRAGNWAAAGLLAVLGVALAGPAGERRDGTAWRNLDGVLLVVDLSASLTGSGRMIDMGAAARLIAEAAGTRQTGLIVYAGEAYLAAPPSTDARAIGGTVALLDAETVPVPGSRPAAALARAAEAVEAASLIAADVILVSDGGGIGPKAMRAAEALAARGATVSTLHVPTPDEPGGRAALAALAEAGGGTPAGLADPSPIVARVSEQPARRLADTGHALLLVEDHGRWLLLFALVPAALLLPRRRPA